ncbi:hypothetical protein chiPu_0022944, partial [Chiloscyllium punctatum]|nr:hypothetical protein [Chiloscyllium punctatum]
ENKNKGNVLSGVPNTTEGLDSLARSTIPLVPLAFMTDPGFCSSCD